MPEARVRSRKTEDVVREVQRLAASGCQEVVLTGIHLSSYGADPEGGRGDAAVFDRTGTPRGADFAESAWVLWNRGIITEEFVKTIAALPRVCPHFHLSLQSGCTSYA